MIVRPTKKPFTKMGMRKNTDYSLATFASNIEIPNWLAATSDAGFEGSVVTGNKLGPALGTQVVSVYTSTRMDNNFAGNVTWQVMKNATVIGTLTVTTATTVQSLTIPGVTIVPGDLLWINATNSNSARNVYAVDTILYYQ